MIVLDTNVISEVMRAAPDPTVIRWLNDQDTSQLFVSSVTVAEISYGLHSLNDGQRKRALKDRFEQFVRRGFSNRLLDFDEAAALAYGELMAYRRTLGRPMGILDGQIAAIARSRGFAVATRNTADFEQSTVELVNPWEAS